jgi:hypothetical protein
MKTSIAIAVLLGCITMGQAVDLGANSHQRHTVPVSQAVQEEEAEGEEVIDTEADDREASAEAEADRQDLLLQQRQR